MQTVQSTLKQFTFQVTHRIKVLMLVSLTNNYANQTLQHSLCHSMMINT